MADILIKGMEMPYSCEYCPIYDYDEKLCRQEPLGIDERYTRDNGCPLVELPPHGDLIDKASALSLLRYYCDMREYKKDIRCEDCENRNACVVRPIMYEVNKLDTVLEAST